MSNVITVEHEWEAISIEPVHVLTDAKGEAVIFTDPDDDVITMYGCRNCDEPLDSALGSECKGRDIDDPRVV